MALSGIWFDLAASADTDSAVGWTPSRFGELLDSVPGTATEGSEAAPSATSSSSSSVAPSTAAGADGVHRGELGPPERVITGSIYEVRPGDALASIAELHAVTLAELIEHNDLPEPFTLMPGQFVRIPVPSSSDPVPTRSAAAGLEPVRASIERWSAAHILPPDLVAAVLWQESRWQADALSTKGAIGVGQLLPSTASWVADELIGEPLDPYVTDDNVRMATRLLRWLVDRAEGNQAAALAAYYQGWSSTSEGWFGETERYVADVFAWRWRFRSGTSG